MTYFSEKDGWPEKVGKVIGDVIALAVYVFVLILMVIGLT